MEVGVVWKLSGNLGQSAKKKTTSGTCQELLAEGKLV